MSPVLADAIAPLLAVTVLLLTPVVIVFLTLKHRRHITEMKLKAMLDLAERGAPVPIEFLAEKPRKAGIVDLRLGMLFACTGIGLIAFMFTMPDRTAWGAGLIPLFAGIGFLVTWTIGRKSQTADKDD
jgi:Domain of unknown function (DUF6249)